MTSVNSVLAFSAIASLPFGGVGDSGFGRNVDLASDTMLDGALLNALTS